MADCNNVLEIRKAIIADIVSLGYSAYYEDASTEAAYPYVIIELPNSDADGANTEIFDLYINAWDDSPDTTDVETMIYNINQQIDGKVYDVSGKTLSFRPVLNNKLSLNDPDVRLKRREYRYSVRSIQRR